MFCLRMWEADWCWADRLLRSEASGHYFPLWTLQAADQIKRLYDLFLKVDATQVEVNPLGETPEGQGTAFSLMISRHVFVFFFSFPSLKDRLQALASAEYTGRVSE